MSKVEEKDLNAMLNTEEVSVTGTEATLAKAKTAPAAVTETPAPVAVAATPAPAAGYVNLFDFITTNRAKIQNAAVTNLASFSRVPVGKFMMFVTNAEDDAELVLFERPNSLWIEQGVTPDAIKVENSGLVIKCNNARYYVGKNNVNKVSITDGKVTGISTIGRAKTSDAVKVEQETVEVKDADVDTIKLYVKKVSPRLYNVVKDMTTKDEIKTGIIDFMSKVYDLNHLVKIEKELLLSLSI